MPNKVFKMSMDSNLIVLCQPDEVKSCGACCGLYNYVDSTRASLTSRLRRRTKYFRETVKTPADVERYASEIKSSEDLTKRYEGIYCCEYLGFLDEREKKVGCLLHPQRNEGCDLRDVSFYGRELCAGHLCPSHYFIPDSQVRILLGILDDWYLYGLCITDIDLVKTYFKLLADRIGEELKPEAFASETLVRIARQYFGWKIDWPFRSADTNRLGKYYFDGSQYMISHIDYEKLGTNISEYNAIFLSLSSVFRNKREIELAQEMISANIDKFVRTYAGGR
ncbi:MAG TPA: hypothetical protein ENN23_03250 [Deltaproteobacteria bacterium]|nr:hypothetical protein [Deltaproteobacteria bacterium]